MIRSDKQLKISEERLAELRAAAESTRSIDRVTWLALVADIEKEIAEYKDIRAGRVTVFNLDSVDDLAEALVKARLACGITQKELADRLQVSEQMVQRDESGAYERATLVRLADVVDALDYELVGALRPRLTDLLSMVNQPMDWRVPANPVTIGSDVPAPQITMAQQLAQQVLSGHRS